VAAALSMLRVTVHAEATRDGELSASLDDLPSAAASEAGGNACIELRASIASLVAALSNASGAIKGWREPAPPTEAYIAILQSALSSVPSADRAALVPLLFLSRALLPELFEAALTEHGATQLPDPPVDFPDWLADLRTHWAPAAEED
jgi:hypothetical protein